MALRTNMTVLVTGAAGFIGAHVVQQLLAEGKSVRATVREKANADFLNTFPTHKDASLEIVEMNLFEQETVDRAVRECVTVIHCAAALMVGVKDPVLEVVNPSVTGTENLCAAIAKAGTVQTIIHTSSVAAIRRTRHPNGHVFSSSDWCDDASPELNPYGFAKAEAERRMRTFVEQHDENVRPRLVTIHPSIVFGPVFHKRHTRGSMAYLKHFTGRLPFVLRTYLNYVDVRDVAKAHVAAIDSGTNGGRYILHKEGKWMKEIGAQLRQVSPGKRWATFCLPSPLALVMAAFHPKLTVSQVRSSLGRSVGYDVGSMEGELGIQLHSSDETLADSIASLLELGRKV